jgi:hypothetical protein
MHTAWRAGRESRFTAGYELTRSVYAEYHTEVARAIQRAGEDRQALAAQLEGAVDQIGQSGAGRLAGTI